MFVFEKENGQIKNRESIKYFFDSLKDGKYTIEKNKKNRSIKQNNYYWLILSYIAHETGDLDYYGLHQYLKARFMKETTTNMDTVEFTDYLDFIRSFALNELGIVMPDAE